MIINTQSGQVQRQIALYTASFRRPAAADKAALRDAVIAVFTADPSAAQAAMQPLVLPEASARVLADAISAAVEDHRALAAAMLADPDDAADQWLQAMTADCPHHEKLAARYALIDETLRRRLAALDGKPIGGEALPYSGGCTESDVAALRKAAVSRIASITPSAAALRTLQQLLDGASGALSDAGDEAARTMTSAVLFAMRCDGSLPEACDEVMLGELVPAVCMTADLQAAAAGDLPDNQTLDAVCTAWRTGLLGLCGGVIRAGLITPALMQAVGNAVPAAAITDAAFALTPVIVEALERVKQPEGERIRRCAQRLGVIADLLAEKEAVAAAPEYVRLREPEIRE